MGVLRTESTPGRGGSVLSTWKLAEAKDADRLTLAGHVSADAAWERIAYFLDRVIPVCNEYKILRRLPPARSRHSADGFSRNHNVLGTVDGLKKFVTIQESPYHGLNFCVGTVAEMLADPRGEICEVIRYFGQRGKIFNIHYRNIRGHRDDFRETCPDDGDMDMVAVARTLAELDYPYMLMPDHMPHHADDADRRQAFAFGYGYIKGVCRRSRQPGEPRLLNVLHHRCRIATPSTTLSLGCVITRSPSASPSSTSAVVSFECPTRTGVKRARRRSREKRPSGRPGETGAGRHDSTSSCCQTTIRASTR